MRIEPAAAIDLSAVISLLEQNHLPREGVREHFAHTLVARDDGRVVGAVGLEVYADGALLRSVAVESGYRGRHLGHELTEAALRLAEGKGARTVFLLTTTAERFFPKFGFSPVARADVPASVQQSIEFRSACPASAVVMRKDLGPAR